MRQLSFQLFIFQIIDPSIVVRIKLDSEKLNIRIFLCGITSKLFGVSNYYNPKLLNGINPCAFAAMVFVTCLLLGMGRLKFLSFLNKFSAVAMCLSAYHDWNVGTGVFESVRCL